MTMIGKEDVVSSAFDIQISQMMDMLSLGEYLHAPSFTNAILDRFVSYYGHIYRTIGHRVPLCIPRFVVEGNNPIDGGLYRFTMEAVSFTMSKKSCESALRHDLMPQAMIEDLLAISIDTRSLPTDFIPWEHYCNIIITLLASTTHRAPTGALGTMWRNSVCLTAGTRTQGLQNSLSRLRHRRR